LDIAIELPFIRLFIFNDLLESSRREFRINGGLEHWNFKKPYIFENWVIRKSYPNVNRSPASPLTEGAEVRAAPGEQNAPYGSSAATAGFAGAKVDAMLQLEETARAVGVDIVGDRRAAQPDRLLEDLQQSLAETFKLGTRKTACRAPGTDSGMKKALVGVDVAHPGQKGLVEQSGFDGEFAAPEKCSEIFRAYRERLGAWRIEGMGAT
jgi:hypothetical protein